jgi:ATP-dependent Lhr-like helicase
MQQEQKNKYGYANQRKRGEIVAQLDELVKEWFFSKFNDFSLTQLYGVMPVWERKNILISAPTGGTKTLTAFLSILNYLVSLARKNELENKVYAVYCSPLKALTNDIHVNLIKPLKEIEELAEKKEIKLQKIYVGLRTGDTEQKEKTKMLKNAPHILVTTPESMAIMINSPKFSEYFGFVEFVIVDEIHNLAENKRGVHLSLTIERLQSMSKIEFSRIGLSATVAPLEKIAGFLAGSNRNYLIADISLNKTLDLQVLSPVSDFLETNSEHLNKNLYELLDNLIQEHKTTLIFTNTRAATERIVHNLKEKFPKSYEEIDDEGNFISKIGAHHSSLSKEHRFHIENALREGKLKVVVTSTSLELGIDIGFVELVILLGSPKSVARAVQRIGRAGHQLHSNPKGKFVVQDQDDLIECAIILKNAKEKVIDKVHVPENCLDVLSQHVFGMAISRVWQEKEMFELIKKSYCYKNLTREDFLSVISYLSGEYELETKNVYAKIWYDSEKGEIGKRGKLARVIYMTNIGTIPDESYANVVLNEKKIGKVDEEFVERLKKGDVFVLGGSRYQYLYAKGMNIYVRSAEGRRPTIPSWFSEMLPLSFDSALAISKFRKLVDEKFLRKKSPGEIKEFIKEYAFCDEITSESIYNYFKEQNEFSLIPHENRILIEEYNADKHYVIFHTLFGRRVNDALSRAVAFLYGSSIGRDLQVGINDNGFFIAGKELNVERVEKAFKKLEAENLKKVLEQAVDRAEILKRRFRHCAARSLMILRNYKGRTKSVGKQQMSSHFLLAAVLKKTKDFPILKEAKREVLEDVMSIENSQLVLKWIKEGKIKIEKKNTKVVSPFAINLLLSSHSDIIRIEDKIEFIKRVYRELKGEK